MEDILAGTYKIPDNYSWRDVKGELIVLNLDSGEYFTFNEIGRTLWLALSEGKALKEAVDTILKEYDTKEGEVLGDIKSYLQGLLDEGLLTTEREVAEE